jgi:hypothetical protein
MNCNDWPDQFKLGPDDLVNLLDELEELLAEGSITVLYQTHPFSAIPREQPYRWPDDTLRWDIECNASGNSYRLMADTYHGSCSWDRI